MCCIYCFSPPCYHRHCDFLISGMKLSPRCPGTPRSPSALPRLGSAIPRPPFASPRESANASHKLLTVGGTSGATDPRVQGENTPCTPVVSDLLHTSVMACNPSSPLVLLPCKFLNSACTKQCARQLALDITTHIQCAISQSGLWSN